MKRQRNKSALLVMLILAAVLGTSAYAFTDNNVISAQVAGDGSATVSGYNVSNVHFSIPDDPTDGTTVTFTLDGAANTVEASGNPAGTSLVPCSNTGGNDWSCDLAQTLHDVQDLRIAASN